MLQIHHLTSLAITSALNLSLSPQSNSLLSSSNCTWGVPQGSVLGLFMLLHGDSIKKCYISFHCYTYSSQTLLRCICPSNLATWMTSITSVQCLAGITSWVAQNLSQLSDWKSEIILFGCPSSTVHNKIALYLFSGLKAWSQWPILMSRWRELYSPASFIWDVYSQSNLSSSDSEKAIYAIFSQTPATLNLCFNQKSLMHSAHTKCSCQGSNRCQI